MKNQTTLIAWIAFLLLAVVQVSGRQVVQETQADIDELERRYEEANQSLFSDFSSQIYFNGSIEEITQKWQDLYDTYTVAKKGSIADLNAYINAFERKYGSSGTAIDDSIVAALGATPSRRTSWIWEEIKKGLEALNAYDVTMAKVIVENVTQDLEHVDRLNPLVVDKKYRQLETLLGLANQFDSSNADAKSLLKLVRERHKAANKKIDEVIDAATWEPHSALFSGPGKANQLAQEVERFIELNDEKGNKDTVVAVRISGDWRVGEKTVLGEPINYGLPVHVAFRMKDDPKTAKVLSLTMITRDKEKKPPFQGNWVGDNWQIRIKNIKSTGGAAGGEPRILFKLLLGSALLISGALAILPWLESNAPKIGENISMFSPFRGIIGVVTALVAVVLFVSELFHPFSNLLPQIGALAVGLLLGMELLLQRSAGTKAEALVRTCDASVRRLEKFQIPLGFGCMGLGLLHLLIGGLWLF